MRHLTLLIFLTALLLQLWAISSTPIDPKRWLINRPKTASVDEELMRYRRLASRHGVKSVASRSGHTRDELEKNLKKGEYVCGNKVCKLKPGDVPCADGLCQYPIHGPIH